MPSTNVGNTSRPSEIRKSPGELLHLAIGFSGADYVMFTDSVKDNGRVVAQDLKVSRRVPEGLKTRLEMIPEQKWIRNVAFGPSGEWFLHYSNLDGSLDQAFWDVPNKLCSNFLQARFQSASVSDLKLVFGPDTSYIILDGDTGYLMSNNVHPDLRKRIMTSRKDMGKINAVSMFESGGYFISDSNGVSIVGAPPKLEAEVEKNATDDIVNVLLAGDYSWVVLRRHQFSVSGIDQALTARFQAIYDHQNLYIKARAAEIHSFEASQLVEKQVTASNPEKTQRTKKKKPRDPYQQERNVTAINKRQVIQRKSYARVKELTPGKNVSIAGFSIEPGDCVIESIEADGTLIVAKRVSSAKLKIDDVKRVCLHHTDQEPLTEIVKLMKATDKFEAASFTVLNTTDTSFSVQQNRSISTSLSNSTSTTETSQEEWILPPQQDWFLKGFASPTATNTEFDQFDDPFGTPTNDPLPSRVASTSRMNRRTTIPEESEPLPRCDVDFLPVFEESGETLGCDEYRCAEKIDFVRLQRLVKDLKKDSAVRLQIMEAMLKRKTEQPAQETKVQALFLKKLKSCHELEEVVGTLYKMIKNSPASEEGCVIHEVEYQHKDSLCRGRLFSIGKEIGFKSGCCTRNSSLQSMPLEWLPTLCGSFGRYVEIECNQVALLCNLAKQLNLIHLIPSLLDYRDNPKRWHMLLSKGHKITEVAAKKWLNVIMLGGLFVYKTWLRSIGGTEKRSEEARVTFGFAVEVAVLTDEILRHPRFRWACADKEQLLAEKRSIPSIQSMMIMRVMQNVENEMLSHIQRCVHNLGWIVRVKVFDSLIVEPGPDNGHTLDDVIEICRTSCQMQGWDIRLTERDMYGLQDQEIITIKEARMVISQVMKSVQDRKNNSK